MSYLDPMSPDFPFTIGIEEEYQVIDPETRELRSYITQILERGQTTPRRVAIDSAIPKAKTSTAMRGYDAYSGVRGWSPDGKWLVVATHFRPKGTDESLMRIVRMTGNGEDPTILVEDRNLQFLGWSPDGGHIAYAMHPLP